MARKKRQAKKEMKVKINGKEQSLNEEVVIKDWSKAKKETAAAEDRLENDEFEWVLPNKNIPEVPEFQPVQGIPESIEQEKKPKINISKYLQTRISPNKKGLIISAILAVAIGLGFGLFVWKLVVNPESSTTLTDAAPAVPSEGKEKGAALTATMPDLSAAVVQGGAFSTEEAAESFSDKFTSQGLPSISLNVDEQQFLFIGVTEDLSTAKTWVEDYKASGIDVYAKEFSISENQIKVDSKIEAEWMTEAPKLFGILAKEAADARSSGQINKQVLQDSEITIKKFEDKNIQQKLAVDLRVQLEDTIKQLGAYSTSQNQESLTKAQQSLLNFLKAYYDGSKGPSV
ncbi:stage II sporulation protein B [Siminovitchia terrae]|uniref:Stage II sporulation protein B n=1 Tax=Siminovitchia terrae TaxID=1914933 RepID=A0A429X755_SIMTE|nr:hypothetical protein [Siminovitchia terrae]RST59268.1 hypothetical protein D5F11_012985 [Siminovitchia terrae]GIN94344.1 stage II sporulation protein B [Siminovitchia terrae]